MLVQDRLAFLILSNRFGSF